MMLTLSLAVLWLAGLTAGVVLGLRMARRRAILARLHAR